MKKTLVGLLCLATLLCLTLTALAAPAVTRGGYTAYLAESNFFYLQDATGASKILRIPMTDIIDVTDTCVYCLAQDGRLLSVPLDGSRSEVVADQATEADIAKVTPAPLYLLEEGKLTLPGAAETDAPLSETALSACTNGDMLFWVEGGEEGATTLKSYQLNTPGATAQIMGDGVAAPLGMTATDDALAMVAEDHSVTVVTLVDRHQTLYPATSEETVNAVVIGEQLLRYRLDETGHLVTEEEPVAPMMANNLPDATYNPGYTTNAPVVTVTAEPGVQPTVTPTVKPVTTQRPSSSSSSSSGHSSGSSSSSGSGSGTLKKGARGEAVRKMQQRLAELGYPVGEADGVWGQDTQLAVNLFQCAIGFAEHDYATDKMLTKLNAKDAPAYDPCRPLKSGDQGTLVRIMQNTLQIMGYDPGKIDGKYGPATAAAVKELQRVANLTVTGEANRDTLAVLYSPTCPVNPSAPQPTTPPQPGETQQPNNNLVTTVVLEGNIAQPRPGDVLTARVQPANATVTYAWYRTGSSEVIGIAPTYTVQPQDMGCSIYCTVVGFGNYDGAVTSAPTGLATSTDMVP